LGPCLCLSSPRNVPKILSNKNQVKRPLKKEDNFSKFLFIAFDVWEQSEKGD
jgi:hypothetical protein